MLEMRPVDFADLGERQNSLEIRRQELGKPVRKHSLIETEIPLTRVWGLPAEQSGCPQLIWAQL